MALTGARLYLHQTDFEEPAIPLSDIRGVVIIGKQAWDKQDGT
jgi:hypothetical protein